MTPPHRNRRFTIVGFSALCLGMGLYLIVTALQSNTQFFYNPSDMVKPDFVAESETYRMGGFVVVGSIERGPGVQSRFEVQDFDRPINTPIRVSYSGALPDLFREGEGVVVVGRLIGDNEFLAEDVLAKHDENYRPKIEYQSPES